MYAQWINFPPSFHQREWTVNAVSVRRTLHFISHGADAKHRQEIESNFVLKLSAITLSTPLKRIVDLQTQDEKWIKRISVLQMRAYAFWGLHAKQPAGEAQRKTASVSSRDIQILASTGLKFIYFPSSLAENRKSKHAITCRQSVLGLISFTERRGIFQSRKLLVLSSMGWTRFPVGVRNTTETVRHIDAKTKDNINMNFKYIMGLRTWN